MRETWYNQNIAKSYRRSSAGRSCANASVYWMLWLVWMLPTSLQLLPTNLKVTTAAAATHHHMDHLLCLLLSTISRQGASDWLRLGHMSMSHCKGRLGE